MSAVQWIDEATAPYRQMVAERVQAVGDMIVGAFDRFMTKMVNEGGLIDAAKAVGNWMGNVKGAVMEHLPSPPSIRKPDPEIEHGQKLGRSGQQVAADVSPALPHDSIELSAQEKNNLLKIRENLISKYGVNLAENLAQDAPGVSYVGLAQGFGKNADGIAL